MSDLTIAAVLEHYGADLHRVRETGWNPVKCPFHEDRTASASVNLAKNAFCCHACGVKGDAIGLIMSQEGLGFKDAANFAETVLGAGVGDLSQPARVRDKRRTPSRWREKLFQ